jgi:hypothetical protein
MKKIILSFILALAATFSFAAIRLPVSKAFWSSSCQCSELCRNLVYIEKEEVTATSSFSLFSLAVSDGPHFVHDFPSTDYPNLGKNYHFYGICCEGTKKSRKRRHFASGFKIF